MMNLKVNIERKKVFSVKSFADPILPTTNIIGPIVRNLAAVQTLQSGLLYPMSSNNSKQSTSPQLQAALFFGIRDVIQRNPINFFLVERTNVLPLLIETMESYSPDVQVSWTNWVYQ
jgi:hypothetical protein